MTTRRTLLVVISATAIAFGGAAEGQQWVNPHFDTHRMDYRDLGYPSQNMIPADNSRITALCTHSNGLLYGATSGKTQSYMFLYNRYINKVRPLGQIAGATGTIVWRREEKASCTLAAAKTCLLR